MRLLLLLIAICGRLDIGFAICDFSPLLFLGHLRPFNIDIILFGDLLLLRYHVDFWLGLGLRQEVRAAGYRDLHRVILLIL